MEPTPPLRRARPKPVRRILTLLKLNLGFTSGWRAALQRHSTHSRQPVRRSRNPAVSTYRAVSHFRFKKVGHRWTQELPSFIRIRLASTRLRIAMAMCVLVPVLYVTLARPYPMWFSYRCGFLETSIYVCCQDSSLKVERLITIRLL